MKLASIREFRSELANFSRSAEMVIVMNHGKMVGCFLPLKQTQEIPLELKKEFVSSLGQTIAAKLTSKKVSEEYILNDFKEFKKSRRR